MDTLLKKYTKKYMYKILDLFSGLGGFSLGLERTGHFKTIAFCDNDKFSKLILDKHWKGVKIYDNVKEITKEKFVADGVQFPNIITGGFPCQPFSVAGKQKGTSEGVVADSNSAVKPEPLKANNFFTLPVRVLGHFRSAMAQMKN